METKEIGLSDQKRNAVILKLVDQKGERMIVFTQNLFSIGMLNSMNVEYFELKNILQELKEAGIITTSDQLTSLTKKGHQAYKSDSKNPYSEALKIVEVKWYEKSEIIVAIIGIIATIIVALI